MAVWLHLMDQVQRGKAAADCPAVLVSVEADLDQVGGADRCSGMLHEVGPVGVTSRRDCPADVGDTAGHDRR